jgi:hypothetical protein
MLALDKYRRNDRIERFGGIDFHDGHRVHGILVGRLARR